MYLANTEHRNRGNMQIRLVFIFTFFSLILFSCHTQKNLTDAKFDNIKIIGDSGTNDSRISKMLLPYKQKLDSQMNEVLIYNQSDLKKELPEGTLNNFVCDELLDYVSRTANKNVDLCVFNYGGLRLPAIYTGNISVGKIYELLPFDNLLVILEIDGINLKKVMEWAASNGGQPVSAALKLELSKENKIIKSSINGMVIDETKVYSILTSDYLANGGDGATCFKNTLSTYSTANLMRDAMIAQLRHKAENNQNLNYVKDGRIFKN